MQKEDFYALLCCPSCRGDLAEGPGESELSCEPCGHIYPVVDGIPVLFPCNVKEKFDEMFGRYWDTPEKADLYNEKVEGDHEFGTYNHESEIYGLVKSYQKDKLDFVLDAGCGNGRFLETLPEDSVKIGLDASLNLLRLVKQRGRGDFLVCGELEHIPFKDGLFSTVISCRVLQHLQKQEEAVIEMARVTRKGGDMILELYNTLNLKTIYKNIRMSPTLSKIFDAPFRLVFRSMSPFGPWPLNYDRYNDWFQVKRWMRKASYGNFSGRGAGFGYHKYFVQPFYIHALMRRFTPGLMKPYFATCFAVERLIGSWIPFRWTMEKLIIKATKAGSPPPATVTKAYRKLRHAVKSSDAYNADALRERKREESAEGVVMKDNRFHAEEAVSWIERAQDATPDGGVSRAYSVGWTAHANARGWQGSYPETTGYIIPTILDCADYLGKDDLKNRALKMADWEIDIQMDNGAVMGGVLNDAPTPAVFNTGQVMLGWLRAAKLTEEKRYLDALRKSADFLVDVQEPDGSWRKGNSQFANPSHTTYNSRVGWALILAGQQLDSQRYIEAGRKNMQFTLSQQRENGWFDHNCLSDPSAPLLHTICYAIEGLLGSYEALGAEEYLAGARRAAESLVERVDEEGRISGRLDHEWQPQAPWNCLTGNAQLAGVLLRLHRITEDARYRDTARRLLSFLKQTQNCVTDDPGLRGGIKGSFPFDGDYGKFEVLNWATKFYLDALLLDEQNS